MPANSQANVLGVDLGAHLGDAALELADIIEKRMQPDQLLMDGLDRGQAIKPGPTAEFVENTLKMLGWQIVTAIRNARQEYRGERLRRN